MAGPGSADRVGRLQRLTGALAHASTAAEVAAIAMAAGLAEAGSVHGSVWLPDGDDVVAVEAIWSNDDRRTSFARVPVTAKLPASQAYRTGNAVWVADASASASQFPDLGRTVSDAYYALPLVGTKVVLGVLAGGLAVAPSEEDKLFLQTIAALCAQALERTQALERERRARETLEFLAEATAIMVGSLDPDEVLHTLVHVAVPGFVPWCAAFVPGDGSLHRAAVAVAGADELPDEVAVTVSVPIDGDSVVARVYRTGAVEKVSIDAAFIRSLYPEPVASRIAALGLATGLAVPVRLRDENLGVLGFATTGSVDSDEFRFAATGLAARAAIAVENAQRHRHEHDVIRTLTEALLPRELPTLDGYDLAARYVPSSGGVCGDWYETGVGANGVLWFAVGDASGHGIAAASTMALARNAAIGLREAVKDPTQLLAMLSRAVAHARPSEIVTAVHGVLEPGSGHLRWCSAGHPHGIVAAADGSVRELPGVHGPPLGVLADYQANWYRLDRGDVLVLYTDGVTERRGEDLGEGTRRLLDVIARAPRSGADELAAAVVEQLCTDPDDDCCLLIVRRLPTT